MECHWADITLKNGNEFKGFALSKYFAKGNRWLGSFRDANVATKPYVNAGMAKSVMTAAFFVCREIRKLSKCFQLND